MLPMWPPGGGQVWKITEPHATDSNMHAGFPARHSCRRIIRVLRTTRLPRALRRDGRARQGRTRLLHQCATSLIPPRRRCYGRERRGCSGRATPSVRSATSEYSRQVAQHISRTEGLRSVTEYRRTVAGRPVAPTPRATADIRDPAVS